MAEKISLFKAGDVIMTPDGEVTVIEVRGRGWQKTEGVPKTWWKTEDLIDLNPTFKETYEAALEAEAKRKEERANGGPGKRLEKTKARIEAITNRITTLTAQKTELEAVVAALEAGEEPPKVTAAPRKSKKAKAAEAETSSEDGDDSDLAGDDE